MSDDPRPPLTARSVIASTLLGVDPPRLPALALVRSGELFGLREGATRTALSRMAAAGEVVADDAHYALAGPLLDRHRRQQAARHPERPPWDGTWVLALVTAQRRSAPDRAAFRDAARRLKLAEVRGGVWSRPDDLDRFPGRRGPQATVDAQASWVRGARPDDIGPFVDAFGVHGWAATARSLIEEMDRGRAALAHGADALPTTFVTSAAVLRHLVADPTLPPELLPADWPGDRLRADYDGFDAAFKATWRDWFRTFRAG